MSSVLRDDREEWFSQAACSGDMGVVFYPPLRPERKTIRTARERRAKMICTTCPVRTDCLAHALDVGERYGIWGGLTESERRHLHTT